jgi:hypothetical protein
MIGSDLTEDGKRKRFMHSIAFLEWENPTHEETHEPFQYWSDDDGMLIIEWFEVTHWMPLPELPEDS